MLSRQDRSMRIMQYLHNAGIDAANASDIVQMAMWLHGCIVGSAGDESQERTDALCAALTTVVSNWVITSSPVDSAILTLINCVLAEYENF